MIYLSPLSKAKKTTGIETGTEMWLEDHIGYKEYDDLVYAEWTSKDQKGLELATQIEIPFQEITLNQLLFKISDHTADSTKVRINVYKLDANRYLEKEPVWSKNHTIRNKRGEEVITVESVPLNTKNIIVGIELLELYGASDNRSLKIAMSKGIGSGYLKKTSHDSWLQLPYSAVGLSLKVLRPEEEATNKSNKTIGTTIQGKVTMSGKRVQGCEIRVKGEMIYTQTRADGSFDIPASENDVLEFRSLTTKPVNLVVKDQENVEITLEAKYDQLEEVLLKTKKEEDTEEERMYMTAFVPRDLKKSGFSVMHKKKEELNKTSIYVSTLIRGKFPAARGSSSFNLSNNRIFVVDGVLLHGNIDDILDPNSIASITLINSVGGNVMYGSAGRNGVFYITTKNAESNWKFLKRKEKADMLLAKNNDYDNSAVTYRESTQGELYGFKTNETIAEAKARYVGTLTTNMTNIDFYIKSFKYLLNIRFHS